MKEIQLTKGLCCIVDDVDGDLDSFNWHAHHSHDGIYYAGRNSRISDSNKSSTILMHREILERVLNRELVKGEYCDHINGNNLDNRRSNLRLSTNSQNLANRGKNKNNKTGYKRVFKIRDDRYLSSIQVNGKSIHLGYFDTPEKAYEAYLKASKEYFGEFHRG